MNTLVHMFVSKCYLKGLRLGSYPRHLGSIPRSNLLLSFKKKLLIKKNFGFRGK